MIPCQYLPKLCNSLGVALSVMKDRAGDVEDYYLLSQDALDFHENKCILFAQTANDGVVPPPVETMLTANSAVRRDWEYFWSMAAEFPPPGSGYGGGKCTIS